MVRIEQGMYAFAYDQLLLHTQQFGAPSCQPSFWKFSRFVFVLMYMFMLYYVSIIMCFDLYTRIMLCIQVWPISCVRSCIGERERRARCSTPECATKCFVVESRWPLGVARALWPSVGRAHQAHEA